MAVLVAVLASSDGWPAELTPEAFSRLIRSWGMWGVAVSILLMVAHSFIPFPAEFMAIANGMCFGPLWGMVITWVGTMLGAVLAFWLSRALGRPFVERMLKREDWRRADQWLGHHGGRAVFFSRFVPIIAFNLINYAAGLTRIPLWTFLWTTGLGILPMTALMVVLGARMDALALWHWLLIGAIGIALWVAGQRLMARRHSQPERSSDRV